MTIPGVVSLFLAVASAQNVPSSDTQSIDAMMCGPATEIFLPDKDRKSAPKIRLEHLQYMSPGDPCGRNFDSDEVTKLYKRVESVAVATLASSNSHFGVMVQYTFEHGKPDVFEMRVRDAPNTEKERLTTFHTNAKALSGFQPKTGTVHVAIEFSISPALPVDRKKGG